MRTKKLLFGAVIFLLTLNVMVSCTDNADVADTEELYGIDKAKLGDTTSDDS